MLSVNGLRKAQTWTRLNTSQIINPNFDGEPEILFCENPCIPVTTSGFPEGYEQLGRTYTLLKANGFKIKCCFLLRRSHISGNMVGIKSMRIYSPIWKSFTHPHVPNPLQNVFTFGKQKKISLIKSERFMSQHWKSLHPRYFQKKS